MEERKDEATHNFTLNNKKSMYTKKGSKAKLLAETKNISMLKKSCDHKGLLKKTVTKKVYLRIQTHDH